MPWHIETDNADCAGVAVVKDDDGSIAGCHDSETEARAQLAALYANEPDMTAADMPMPMAEPDPYEGMAEVPVYGVLAVEGIETGDMPRREFAPNALTWAPLPISFKWQEHEGDEHKGACVVGRIDAVWRDGALIRWTGFADNVGEYGREMLRLRRSNFIRGVSIKADDLDRTDIEMIYPTLMPGMDEVEILGDEEDLDVEGGEDFHYPGRHNQKDHGYGKSGKGKASNRQKAAAAKRIKARGDRFLSGDRAVDGATSFEVLDDDPNLLPDDEQDMGFEMMGMAEPTKLIFHAARIRSATVVAEPAYVEATFEIGESPIPVPLQTSPGTPGEMPEEVIVASAPQTCGTIDPNWRGGPTLVAGASYTITIPEVWPESWFEEPTEAPPIGALNITAAGRVYGYLAPAGVTHRGFRGKRNVYAPTRIDYSEFQNKGCLVASADGQVYKINAGNVTFDCGHASPTDPRRADPAWAAEHYENSCSIAARVRVGENRHGTWVAGALLHGITPDAVERMMACALSGDWQDGKLKGALLVPVEGFPRAQTASVRVRADEADELSMVASSVPVVYEPAEEVVTLSRDTYDALVASAFGQYDSDRFAQYAAERFDEIARERG